MNVEQFSDIVVDREFASLIPALSDDERRQLEENIVDHGGARDPLVVWAAKGKLTLLDGHNRYEICSRRGLPFDVHEMRFATRDDAADWIDRNQLGRRNLHPDAFTLLLGRRYNRAKKPGRPSEKPGQNVRVSAEALAAEHGVDEKTVRRAGKVAAAVDKLKTVDPTIEEKVSSGRGPVRAAVVKAAALLEESPDRAREIIEKKKPMADVLREEKKAEKERIKEAAIEKLSRSEAESFGISHCCITQWNPPKAALIFTDPPYHDKHVERFRELGLFAMGHLEEGRFLCTYTGKLRLSDCVSAILETGMEWVWIFSVYHPFSKEKHLGGVYNIAENWRPVLVFRKPGPVWTPNFQQDVVRGQRSKSHHDWSQDEETPEQLIQAYSAPGEIVLDPFCGGGTTPLVAKRVGRKCFACDVDIAAVAMATDRLRGNQGR
jgi:DNA modification methylase